MPQTNPDSVVAMQPELMSGESVIWADKPKVGVVFHKQDGLLIPFSLLWGGFAIFWEAGVSGWWGLGGRPSLFMIAWGIPFVLVGQYLIWGRFLYAAWLKRHTHYALTNRRVLVLQNGWKRRLASAYLDSLPAIIKETGPNGVGVLRFAPAQPIFSRQAGWGAWNGVSVGDLPTFIDIESVDSIYQLVSDLREKARQGKATF